MLLRGKAGKGDGGEIERSLFKRVGDVVASFLGETSENCAGVWREVQDRGARVGKGFGSKARFCGNGS